MNTCCIYSSLTGDLPFFVIIVFCCVVLVLMADVVNYVARFYRYLFFVWLFVHRKQ